ncbi:hypothetical protein [Pseudorhodoferax soli]|uniref:Uncharacterized protein n=1 Tax=Pseudorhodoferax soli TaxID=545864 RepID=A0A368Y627_9BURK|nr:hypothetical protein [Pseudorhodoferax soli]RCW75733.1 hypothetical protein DES41_101328 [Pseudorhodoferax soli]
MSLLQPTKELLQFLQKNPGVRSQIRAAPDRTLLYAGEFFRPVWQELSELKRSNAQMATKEILPDVLARISTHGMPYPNLLLWAKEIDKLPQEVWKQNGFVIWRALSGLFASNAVGAVSFSVGSRISKDHKVFAATEIAVLARNPNVDAMTKDILAYFQRCVQTKQANMNFGFIAG